MRGGTISKLYFSHTLLLATRTRTPRTAADSRQACSIASTGGAAGLPGFRFCRQLRSAAEESALQGRARLLKRHEAHMMRSARGHALRHVRLLQALANERARPRRSARGAHELPLGEPPCIARPLPPLRKPHARR